MSESSRTISRDQEDLDMSNLRKNPPWNWPLLRMDPTLMEELLGWPLFKRKRKFLKKQPKKKNDFLLYS